MGGRPTLQNTMDVNAIPMPVGSTFSFYWIRQKTLSGVIIMVTQFRKIIMHSVLGDLFPW